MRIVNVNLRGRPTLAVRRGRKLINLAKAAPDLPRDLKGLLELGEAGLKKADAAARKAPASALIDEKTVSILPPILNPSKIFCLGVNYADHAAEMASQKPSCPLIFCRHSNSLVGHNGAMIRPAVSDHFDYEGEMVAFIGRTIRHASIEEALDAVIGYSVFNDGSIRDFQRMTSQFTMGKNFDDTGGFGPEFVSADELPRGGHGLKIQTRLNGKIMQNSNTRLMLFPVGEALSFISQGISLYPGDLLVSGTPGGVGAARKPPVWMKAGDVVEVEVEKIGLLRNAIADEGPLQSDLNKQTPAPKTAKSVKAKKAPAKKKTVNKAAVKKAAAKKTPVKKRASKKKAASRK